MDVYEIEKFMNLSTVSIKELDVTVTLTYIHTSYENVLHAIHFFSSGVCFISIKYQF